jgi:hypothetical protein
MDVEYWLNPFFLGLIAAAIVTIAFLVARLRRR